MLTLVIVSTNARADVAARAGGMISLDEQGYRWDQYELQLQREVPTDSQWLRLRWHYYELRHELAGIAPFAGHEPAAAFGGHVFHDLWWVGASLGFQGTPDPRGITGQLVLARAIPVGEHAFTPKLMATREPLTLTALPLSLALFRLRGDAILEWRAPSWVAEGGARVERWEPRDAPGRVNNAELSLIQANHVAMVYGHVLSDWKHGFDMGLAGKAAWSERNTLVLTGSGNVASWTWYPASAPPFAWETALVLRAQHESELFGINLQLQLPLASQETRAWGGVQRTFWGTAPFEGKLELSWSPFTSTTFQLLARGFARPWEQWNIMDATAYRQGSLQLFVEQRL